MHTSNVTRKGQVTIPVEMRRALKLTAGSRVRFSRAGKKIMLTSAEEPSLSSLFGSLKAPRGRGVPDVDAALEQLRRKRHGR